MKPRCIAILGGSFDPVHNGHVALGIFFAKLLEVDELRVIPAGNPWQKHELHASTKDRLHMAAVAFADVPFTVKIDPQEILRPGATYTIDTLRALREKIGDEPSLSLLIGADQLQRLHTWREWRAIFDHAHLCAASRPGFAIDVGHLDPAVQEVFSQHLSTAQQLREQPHGLSLLSKELAAEVSATDIRKTLLLGQPIDELVPTQVLDYIKQHNLYK